MKTFLQQSNNLLLFIILIRGQKFKAFFHDLIQLTLFFHLHFNLLSFKSLGEPST